MVPEITADLHIKIFHICNLHTVILQVSKSVSLKACSVIYLCHVVDLQCLNDVKFEEPSPCCYKYMLQIKYLEEYTGRINPLPR